jgi:hypothetical protein
MLGAAKGNGITIAVEPLRQRNQHRQLRGGLALVNAIDHRASS